MKKFLPCCAFLLAAALGAAATDSQKVAPKVLETVSPGYPEELTDTGLSGQAEVDIVVKADGSVADVELAMATHRAFGRAAKAAVKSWKFKPGEIEGVAADMKVSVPFRFSAPLDQQVNAQAKRKAFALLAEPALSQKDYGAKLKVKRPARPIYPRGAGGGEEPTVQVSFVVAPDGSTLNPTVVGNAPKDFVLPALVAVALMAYEPPSKNGAGVYVETTTKLEFTNDRGGFGGGRGGDFGGGGGGRGGGSRGGGGGRDGS